MGLSFAVIVAVSVPVEAAHLSGEVVVDGGKALKNLVVFLRPADGTAVAAAARESYSITQRGRVFRPDFAVVLRDADVDFVNNEEMNIDHNVFSLSEVKKFDIGLGEQGSTHSIQFENGGLLRFYCSIHKNMEGTIVVVPTPFYAYLEAPGSFVIGDVPPGNWVVDVAVTHRRYAAEPVEITLDDAAMDNLVVTVAKKKRK